MDTDEKLKLDMSACTHSDTSEGGGGDDGGARTSSKPFSIQLVVNITHGNKVTICTHLTQLKECILQGRDQFGCEKLIEGRVKPFYDKDIHYYEDKKTMETTKETVLEESYQAVRKAFSEPAIIIVFDACGYSQKIDKSKMKPYGWSHSFHFLVHGAGSYACGADVKFIEGFDKSIYKEKGSTQAIRMPWCAKGIHVNPPPKKGQVDNRQPDTRYKIPMLRFQDPDGKVIWKRFETVQDWEKNSGFTIMDCFISYIEKETLLLPPDSHSYRHSLDAKEAKTFKPSMKLREKIDTEFRQACEEYTRPCVTCGNYFTCKTTCPKQRKLVDPYQQARV